MGISSNVSMNRKKSRHASRFVPRLAHSALAAFVLFAGMASGCSDDEPNEDSTSTAMSTTVTSSSSSESTTSEEQTSSVSPIEVWEVDFYPDVWTSFEQTLQPRVRVQGTEQWSIQGCGIDGFMPILGNLHTIRIEKIDFADPMTDGCGWQVRFIEQLSESRVPAGTEFEIVRMRGENFISGVAGWSFAGINFECTTADLCTAVQEASTTGKNMFYTVSFAIPPLASDAATLKNLTQVPF